MTALSAALLSKLPALPTTTPSPEGWTLRWSYVPIGGTVKIAPHLHRPGGYYLSDADEALEKAGISVVDTGVTYVHLEAPSWVDIAGDDPCATVTTMALTPQEARSLLESFYRRGMKKLGRPCQCGSGDP